MRSNKKIFFLCTLLLAFAINSCVKQKFDTPALSEFASSTTGNEGSYYVTDNANTVFKVPIGITTSSNKDRVINFTVTSSSAVAGQQYTIAANSITIPAGKILDSIEVKGIYTGYPIGRKDTLVFAITGGDVTAFSGSDKYSLILQRYCDVVLNDFAGDYANTEDTYPISGNNYGPYTTTVTPGTSSGTTGTIVVDNIYDPGVAVSTTVKLDWTNPGAFTATIPDQVFFAGADLWIKSNGGGTFSSCDNTFTLKYSLYYKTSGQEYDEGITVLQR